MMIKRLKDFLKGFLIYHGYKSSIDNKADKIVYLEIYDCFFTRYLYNFVKFFHLEGYQVHLPRNYFLIASISKDTYCRLILKEGLVNFGKPRCTRSLIISNDTLSGDYFYPLLSGKPVNSFVVPMSEHPLMYSSGLWNMDPQSNLPRKCSIFMAGNFDEKIYGEIEADGFFNVASRTQLFTSINDSTYLLDIKTIGELENFIKNHIDKKLVLLRFSNGKLTPEDLKRTLKNFNFFLALPGVAMPFSHNLIEAMQVGSIPLIQKDYADLLYPKLENLKTCIVFNNLEEFSTKVKEIFELDAQTIERLRLNVLTYYKLYLTPKAVVTSIAENAFDKIYLMATHNSISLIKQNPARYNLPV